MSRTTLIAPPLPSYEIARSASPERSPSPPPSSPCNVRQPSWSPSRRARCASPELLRPAGVDTTTLAGRETITRKRSISPAASAKFAATAVAPGFIGHASAVEPVPARRLQPATPPQGHGSPPAMPPWWAPKASEDWIGLEHLSVLGGSASRTSRNWYGVPQPASRSAAERIPRGRNAWSVLQPSTEEVSGFEHVRALGVCSPLRRSASERADVRRRDVAEGGGSSTSSTASPSEVPAAQLIAYRKEGVVDIERVSHKGRAEEIRQKQLHSIEEHAPPPVPSPSQGARLAGFAELLNRRPPQVVKGAWTTEAPYTRPRLSVHDLKQLTAGWHVEMERRPAKRSAPGPPRCATTPVKTSCPKGFQAKPTTAHAAASLTPSPVEKAKRTPSASPKRSRASAQAVPGAEKEQKKAEQEKKRDHDTHALILVHGGQLPRLDLKKALSFGSCKELQLEAEGGVAKKGESRSALADITDASGRGPLDGLFSKTGQQLSAAAAAAAAVAAVSDTMKAEDTDSPIPA
eukprot:TRINITY_DN15338_c0_g1_i1.p1 TRINITY_DN15338_c0_g1~~TRINITY_DN15338_c0_g1_i1.p1  ORF type:complete len:519 (+),score=127.16 TRINITY_DN15338_c0_g1_i1:59-1615(+)